MPKLKLEPFRGIEAGVGYRLMRGDLVLGVGGAVEVRPGCWQLWSKPGPMTRASWGYVLLVTREVMNALRVHCGARRFELYIRAGHPPARRLARRLGFTKHVRGRVFAGEPHILLSRAA